jgi:hypothetical protein
MNVFRAVIEGIASLGRGTSQREIKRAEAAAPIEGTADGEAVERQRPRPEGVGRR